jgi:nicotinamidase-related amidase
MFMEGQKMTKALLLIDIQNDYFPGGLMELVGMEEACNNAAYLLNAFREKKLSVIHVRHLSVKQGSTFFLPGTTGAEIHESLTPLPGEIVIEKHFPNAFRDTALLEIIHGRRIEELVICGAMTHMCIDATTRAAFDLGFRCTLIEDACATRNLQHKNVIVKSWKVQAAFLAALGPVYAAIASAAEYAEKMK